MELERLSASVRPRNPSEAIDLGFALVRRDYWKMLLASLCLCVPLLLALHVVFYAAPGWVPVIFWWLKPIWERTHLFILSRRLFGDEAPTSQVLAEFKRYGRLDFVQWITYRRLSMTRSFDLPITQLEGLRGVERAQRLRDLHQGRSSGAAQWLTIVVVHFESFLSVASLALIQLLTPDSSEFSIFSLFGDDDLAAWSSALTILPYYAAVIATAPFYVGGGFGLYINRRAILEGWDLEIAFRRLASRVRGARRPVQPTLSRVVPAVTILLLASICYPSAADASTRATEASLAAASEALREVLAGDEFHRRDTIRLPRFVHDWQFDPSADPDTRNWDRLSAFFEWLALTFEALLVGSALLLVGLAIYRYRGLLLSALGRDSTPQSRKAAVPEVLMGLDVRPESLPADVAQTVLGMWRTGERRAAYGTLYRATLVALMSHHRIDFRQGDTEGDCVRAVRSGTDVDRAFFFAELTEHWQRLAYAHRPPSDETVEQLCVRWTLHFGGVASDAGESRVAG